MHLNDSYFHRLLKIGKCHLFWNLFGSIHFGFKGVGFIMNFTDFNFYVLIFQFRGPCPHTQIYPKYCSERNTTLQNVPDSIGYGNLFNVFSNAEGTEQFSGYIIRCDA